MWLVFALFTLSAAGYFALRFTKGDRRFLVPGKMSAGHYPIETECDRCHTPLLGVKTDACAECHAAELERADDSHPRSKFDDPRNADRLTKLDARECVVCHIEHRPELTLTMGVTQPVDVCRNCHDDIAKERPSHEKLGFDTCQDAGCHNFHDNRALNEDYLEQHLDNPPLLAAGHLPETRGQRQLAKNAQPALLASAADGPGTAERALLDEWEHTTHAKTGVNCRDCHERSGKFETQLDEQSCKRCHEHEVAGFLGGKHGMRLALHLSPMQPSMARLPMQPKAANRTLGCTSCHGAHRFDRAQAAVEACLGCHADRHSLAYRQTKHYALFVRESRGELPAGSGVSCATCHLPRAPDVAGGVARVQHNQNDYLRPNEKLIESVCRHCHGVGFAIDALADRAVIARGVDGRPVRHVKSLDMVRDKLAALKDQTRAAP